MIDLSQLSRISVPRGQANQAYEHLKAVGKNHVEGVALWAGTIQATTFHVSETIIPEQTSLRLPSGLLYLVDDDELHRINVWLHKNGLSLIAQLHSHPTHAYHSDTDDAYPIVTALGSLSIVVPNFARGPLSPDRWAVYRLTRQGWTGLDAAQAARLVVVAED